MTSRVQVSKSWLAALAGVAGLAVLGVVFLLGRESSRSMPPQPQRDTAGASLCVLPTQAVATLPALAQGSPADPGALAPEPALPPSTPPVPASAAPGPAPAPRASVPVPSPGLVAADPTGRAVAAYFRATEALQPQTGGTPDAMAQQVMAGFGTGDTSSFDAMLQQAQDTRNRMAAIAPPQPCAAYHRETLACLDEGLDLLRSIKKAISANPDPQAPNLTDQANDLKARSQALQLQEQALKRSYGLGKS